MLDFVLQEARVFFQGLFELSNAVADLQQLHRVAVMVPRRRYVLKTHRQNVKSEETNM